MAIYSKILELLNGQQKTIDLSVNTLAVGALQVNGVLLSSSTNGSSGAGQIGDGNVYSNISPSSPTVESALASIDSALAASVSGHFSDAMFDIYNSSDNTKKIVFSAAGIATGTTRTITMPNFNVDLGHLTNNNIDAAAAIAYSKLNLSASVKSSDMNSQSATSVQPLFANGSGGAAYRSIVSGDLPDLSATYQLKSEKGQPNGYASLDGSGLIPIAQMPVSVMEYKGAWDASTNSPTLADGTGISGYVYRVSVAGTQNLGSGSFSYFVGDWVIYNGSIWQRSPLADGVVSVNGATGAVTVNAINQLTGDVTTSVASGSQSLVATLTNSAVTGQLLTGYVSGAGTVSATDSILTAIEKLNGNDGNFATRALDNLNATAVNADINPGVAAARNLGSNNLMWNQMNVNNIRAGAEVVITKTGTLTPSSFVIPIADTSGLVVGQYVSGSGIPDASTITSIITNTSITISPIAGQVTGSGSTSLQFLFPLSVRTQTRTGTDNSAGAFFRSGDAVNSSASVVIRSGSTSGNGSTTGSLYLLTSQAGGSGSTRGNVYIGGSSILVGGGQNGGAFRSELDFIPATSQAFPTISDSDLQKNLGSSTARWNFLHVGFVTADSSALSLNGTSINVNNLQINNLADPTAAQDAVTKSWVSNLSNIDAANRQLSNLDAGNVAINADLVPDTDNLYFVGTSSKRWKEIDVITVSAGASQLVLNGAGISASSQVISNVADPVSNQDAVTKNYLINSAGDMIAFASNRFSVDLATSGGLSSTNPGNDAGQLQVNVDSKTTAINGSNQVSVLSAPLAQRTLVAGESFAANTSFAVRFALSGETAGRVYKADKDASVSNNYLVIGIAMSTSSVSAGGNINVVMLGESPLGSSDTAFSSGDIGKELFLGSSGALILAAALSNATGEAQYIVGAIKSTSSIWVDFKQLRGIA